jgi:hypothetical protein
VPWCRWLGARSIAKSVHLRYVVDIVALGSVFLGVLEHSRQYHLPMLHTHCYRILGFDVVIK